MEKLKRSLLIYLARRNCRKLSKVFRSVQQVPQKCLTRKMVWKMHGMESQQRCNLIWPLIIFIWKGFLESFAIFTEKHLCLSLFLIILRTEAWNIIKKRLQYKYFPVNIAKFLRTAIFMKHLWCLLLTMF